MLQQQLLTVNKKFPEIKSAINIKVSRRKLLKKSPKKIQLVVKIYDRQTQNQRM